MPNQQREAAARPQELVEAARVEGAGPLQILWWVYVPLARPTYVAFGLVSVSYHWNNFLWPLIVTNSVEARPLTVGLQVFSSGDQGIDWAVICAATLMTRASSSSSQVRSPRWWEAAHGSARSSRRRIPPEYVPTRRSAAPIWRWSMSTVLTWSISLARRAR